jgi:hypothetical protein
LSSLGVVGELQETALVVVALAVIALLFQVKVVVEVPLLSRH